MSHRLRIDLHVHTVYSGDALTQPREAVLWARKKGLQGIAITDHDTLKGALRAQAFSHRGGVLVIPGLEVESRGGHILALGITEPVRSGLSLMETLDAIREQGGLAILAHPYNVLAPRSWSPEGLRRLDAIEVVNASQLLFGISHRLAVRLARSLGKPMVAGSDAHFPEAIGKAYTLFEAEFDMDSVLEALKKGKVRPMGGRMEFSLIFRKWAIPG